MFGGEARGRRTWVVFLPLATACAGPPVTIVAAGSQVPPGISVEAFGDAEAPADMADLELEVVFEAATPGALVPTVQGGLQSMRAALAAAGVPSGDVETRAWTLSQPTQFPRHASGEPIAPPVPIAESAAPKADEFRATVRVTVAVRDLSKLDSALGAAKTLGAKLVGPILLEVSDPTGVQARATERAIASARKLASAMADAAGVRLGNPVSMTEKDSDLSRAPSMPEPVTFARPRNTRVVKLVSIVFAIDGRTPR